MLKLVTHFCVFVLSILFIQTAYATPKEIIIIRHADKWPQPNPGAALSPRGVLRSIAFGFYFLNKFGEPDYIVATDPTGNQGKSTSILELQTVAPLASMVASRHPEQGFPILHPYSNADYAQLANDLLNNPTYNGKTVLICSDHKAIPQLAHNLGVSQKIKTWPAYDFDSVYTLNYSEKGNLDKFEVLPKQYDVAVADTSTWEQIYGKIK